MKKSTGNARVLVLGSDSRATLAVARSLGRRGLTVVLGTEDARAPAAYSRLVSRTIIFPSLVDAQTEWQEKLASVLAAEQFDLVIPATEAAWLSVIAGRAVFSSLAPLAIPDEHGFRRAHFKASGLALARELHIPVPRSIFLEKKEDAAAMLQEDGISFPVILKPGVSKVWKDGYRVDLSVRRADDQKSLVHAVEAILAFAPVLIQEYLPGIGVGQEFLCERGKILVSFQHERIHEPEGSGGSSFRKSAALHEAMRECSEKLLAALGWTGVAMVEYRWDPQTDVFSLMEINGRFWGSLPLALGAGVDFPYGLYELLVLQKKPVPRTYLLGLRARNLRQDVAWFLRKYEHQDPIALGLRLAGFIAGATANLLLGREQWDMISADDPLPGIVELWQGIGAIAWGLRKRISCFVMRAGRFSAEEFRMRAAKNPRILFVCRGNIIRSPFAEAYARGTQKKRGWGRYDFFSAGLHPKEGRAAPPFAVLSAKELGVSLEGYRSRVLDRDMVERAGVILCMEAEEYRAIAKSFPDAKPKLFLLASLRGEKYGSEISDPWGRSPDDYGAAYRIIADSIKRLLEILHNGA